ncbi:MAG: DUF4127 family protein [Schwartzia sp.]|nr:DUF4127 family protein [Schwartzia sp. (in: firmicutes)]
MARQTIGFIVVLIALLFSPGFMGTGQAAGVGQGKRILFIPLDNRPITDRETWEVAAKLGYEMVVPPDELLGSVDRYGDPDRLWDWLRANAPGAGAAVISTDAMLYGSLVGSRNHEWDQATLSARVQRFRELHEAFPRLPLYGFSTVLRTLLSNTHSGPGMEPAEYQKHAVKIYEYSALRDKVDMGQGNRRDQKEMERLQQEISPAVMKSWEERHQLNYDANESLIDLARQGVFSFLFVGGDDSAPLSQTHYEIRRLREYGRDLGKTRFQVIAGSDELAMVMLCRAVNDDRRDYPLVCVAYSEGTGRHTIPSYSFEEIGIDIDATIVAAGGLRIPAPERAELVLAVSTAPDGRTREANAPSNTIRPNRGTREFVSMVKELVEKGYPVGVGDIAFANGADNALMEQLRQEGLLQRLRAYGGWNTATNTMGFLIGSGLLTKWMTPPDAEALRLKRYLDEWAYQANIRGRLAGALGNFPGEGDGMHLNGKRDAAMKQGTAWMAEFAAKNIPLPSYISLRNLRVSYPWNRLFECDIDF